MLVTMSLNQFQCIGILISWHSMSEVCSLASRPVIYFDQWLISLACSNTDPGDWGNPAAEWRPLMVASGRHGLIEGEVTPRKGVPDDLLSSATSESSQRVSIWIDIELIWQHPKPYQRWLCSGLSTLLDTQVKLHSIQVYCTKFVFWCSTPHACKQKLLLTKRLCQYSMACGKKSTLWRE